MFSNNRQVQILAVKQFTYYLEQWIKSESLEVTTTTLAQKNVNLYTTTFIPHVGNILKYSKNYFLKWTWAKSFLFFLTWIQFLISQFLIKRVYFLNHYKSNLWMSLPITMGVTIRQSLIWGWKKWSGFSQLSKPFLIFSAFYW